MLPGAIIFRLPVADRAKRAALPAEERLFWSVVISVDVSTTIAFALAAMGVYSLPALVWCNVGLAAVLALVSRGNLRLGAAARHAGLDRGLPAALIAAGAWMYFGSPAAEYVIGGRDPGVYVNEGIQIAQSRSLVTTDRLAAAVPAATRDLFFPDHTTTRATTASASWDSICATLKPAPLPASSRRDIPIWIAIAYGLDGVTGTRRVIAWWAILGVLTVYFAGKRLIGPLPRRGGGSALRARHTDVVCALPEFRNRHAGVALCGAARPRIRARR